MGLYVTARTFNSVINYFITLALPHVVLIFVHLQQSLRFLSNHWEISELLGHDKVRLAPLTFSFSDLLLFVSSLMTLFLKGKLKYSQYLTDTENCIYRFVILVSFLCSCGYLLFALETLFYDHITAKLFHQKLLSAMRAYPSDPTKPLVDHIQIKYSCCGSGNFSDWFAIDWYSRKGNWTNDDVPFSCCSNALRIPCIHLNLKRHTYYVKYNSSAPTIWTCGCVTKFTEVYLVDYKWLIYYGICVSFFSLFMALLDRMLQTADNTFCYESNFRLGLFAHKTPWKKLIMSWRRREELVQAQSTVKSKPRSLRSCCSILSRFHRKRQNFCGKCNRTAHSRCSSASGSHRSHPPPCTHPTVMPLLLSPGEDGEVCRRVTSSITSTDSSSVIDEPSKTSSSSGRKRKSEDNYPSDPSIEKRLKKLN